MTSNLISDLADHIDDAISDHAISVHSRGTNGTLAYAEWLTCDHCGYAGENQTEIQHSGNCPVGWVQDLIDDIRNQKETGDLHASK